MRLTGGDACAHRGALGAEGVTIAVTAGGLDEPYPAGHARNPLGPDGVAWKFRRNVRGLLDRDRAEAIVAAVYALDRLHALAELTPLLAAPVP